jgi:hypothetical protein
VTKPFTGPYFYEEMQGIADGSFPVPFFNISGAKLNAQQAQELVWIHMFPGLTQGHCSMVGAWGQALDPSSSVKLLQLRALGVQYHLHG